MEREQQVYSRGQLHQSFAVTVGVVRELHKKKPAARLAVSFFLYFGHPIRSVLADHKICVDNHLLEPG